MLELLTGTLLLSLLHAAIPNHWAPVLAVARAERWPLRRAVGLTAVAGLAHVLSTVLLGLAFLGFQAEEYIHAYKELGLTLGSGVYGATFFMLTGFHGAHVTIGTIILFVMLMRVLLSPVRDRREGRRGMPRHMRAERG